MKTPEFWQSKNGVSTLLLPLSALYACGVSLWKKHVPDPVSLPVPVICIGNVTAGGAGKTPVAMAIGERFKAKTINAFFLSRGYGGILSGPVLVDAATDQASEVGDEPLLLARTLPTVVAKDRAAGGRFACEQGTDLIIMDDGFQNHGLAKTLSLLVVDGHYGFGNGRMLPAGPLREPLADAFARADAVIVIGDGNVALPDSLKKISARLTPCDSAKGLRGKNVFAFCGLAYPQKFFGTLTEIGATVAGTASFADHHAYSDSELKELAARAKAAGAILVTTAKDAVRLNADWKSQVTVVEVSLTFDHPNQLDDLLSEL